MARTRKTLIAAALVVAAILLGLWISGKIHERHGAGAATVTIAKQQEKAASVTIVKTETKYVHDTVRVGHASVHYDTLRTTLNIHDTVEVIRFVAAADSVKKACTDVVLSCDQRDSAHKAMEAALRLENQGIRAELPTRTEKFVTAGKWTLFGAALEAAAAHIHH